mgnify:CR=1 FL=1
MERTMKLDALDHKIIAALEADARISFAALAELVGLSKTPCWKWEEALEEAGVIRGYRTALDPARLGFVLEAFVQASIGVERFRVFEADARRHPLVWRWSPLTCVSH